MRKAFTLIELLVVIFIISLLIAIVLPAIQGAREAARRTQCTNHQKQLAIAFIHYENVHKGLPGWRDFIMVDDIDGEVAAQGSWVFSILPYIEQTSVFDALKRGRNAVEPQRIETGDIVPGIALLDCPSHANIPLPRQTTYIVNTGAVDDFTIDDPPHTIDISVANGPFLDRAAIYAAGDVGGLYTLGGNIIASDDLAKHRNTVARLDQIAKMDGTAYTLLTSENTKRGWWISNTLFHFYHYPEPVELPDGSFTIEIPDVDDVHDGVTWTDLPGGKWGPNPIQKGSEKECSVGFTFPRWYASPANFSHRVAYFREGRGGNNPYQGFTGACDCETTCNPRGTYEPIDRGMYDGGGGTAQWIPVYLGLFPQKTFNSWYHSSRPASYHPTIVIASFCDGNVRGISTQIAERTFVQIMTCHDDGSDAGWQFSTLPYQLAPPLAPGESNFLEGMLFDSGEL